MNNDYKYVMHDLTNIYIGAKYTYDELMEKKGAFYNMRKLQTN